MSDHLVGVAKGDEAYQTTMEALERVPAPPVAGKKVLIKPNAARKRHYSTGATTHPMVVAAAIDYFRTLGAAEVAVGESPITGVRVAEAFEICGIKDVAAQRNAPLLDFDAQPYQIVDIPGGRLVNRIKVTWFWGAYDFVVSMPVMKTHMHTLVTLSVKNMKGLLWRRQKVIFHQLHAPEELKGREKELELAIADMSSVLYPDMAVIDGMVGMEGLGPSAGQPKGAGLVVAGGDALAADRVACRLMGIDPDRVAHLRLAAAYRGFDPESVRVTPKDYDRWKAPFVLPPEKISFRYPGVKVHDKESCSACQNTLYLFLEKYHHRLGFFFDQSKELHLALGKGVTDLPKDTVFVGNCCCQLPEAEEAVKVFGCPPVESQILEKIRINTPQFK